MSMPSPRNGINAILLLQLSQAGDLIIEVYLEQKLPDFCVTLKVSSKGHSHQGRAVGHGLLALLGPRSHSATTYLLFLCVLPQVSPTMTAEELTNQVLEMRNVAASLDIWLTFEVLENGELGKNHEYSVMGCSGGICCQEQGGWWLEKGKDTTVMVSLVFPERPLHPKEKVLEQALQWCKLPEPSAAYLLVRKVPIGEGSCLFTGVVTMDGPITHGWLQPGLTVELPLISPAP